MLKPNKITFLGNKMSRVDLPLKKVVRPPNPQWEKPAKRSLRTESMKVMYFSDTYNQRYNCVQLR